MDVSNSGFGVLAPALIEDKTVRLHVAGKKIKGLIVYRSSLPASPYESKPLYRLGVQIKEGLDNSFVEQVRLHGHRKSKTTAN